MAVDRTPKPCLHKRANHQHGERATYVLDRCRCYPCAAANSAHENRRSRQKAYGRSTTHLVDAEPVRAHVRALQAAGMGHKRIARAAGVTPSSVGRLIYGRRRENGHHEPPTRRMNPEDAQRLLAVPMPAVEQLGATVNVDGCGTRRRLQALVAVGWSQRRLSERLDMEPGNFGRTIRADRVYAATAVAVRALYDDLWNQAPPAANRFEQAGITRARRHAATQGWTPAGAWDDDTIDDPAARPQVEQDVADDVDEYAIELVLDGQPMALTGRDLEVAALRLVEAGHDYAAIAARVRSNETTVRRVLNTVRQRAARAAAHEGTAA